MDDVLSGGLALRFVAMTAALSAAAAAPAAPTAAAAPAPAVVQALPTTGPAASAAASRAWVAVRREGTFFLRPSASAGPGSAVTYGRDGDFPLLGDWDGDGTPGIGFVRAGQWRLRSTPTPGQADLAFGWARPGDLPVVGDWDGEGRDGIGVVRGGTWFLRQQASAGPHDVFVRYGRPDDVAVTGDWDGDGRTGIGVYRDGTWHLTNVLTGGSGQVAVAFGRPTDRPVVGDWDGDGRDGIGVVRAGRWYVRDSLTGPTRSFGYGSACDLPLTSSTAYAPRRGGGPLRADQRGREIEVLPTSERVVALTFDAGANADAMTSILATLRSRCVPGTFFLTGRFARTFPAESAAAGLAHPIANHSDSHPDLTTLPDTAVRAQLTVAEASLITATRGDPRPMFRYPFGARDARTQAIVASLGYTSLRWTVDTLGWQGTSGGQSASTVTARVLAGLRPGEIVLMHVGSHPVDGSMLDAAALGQVIDALRARGYGFATIDQFT